MRLIREVLRKRATTTWKYWLSKKKKLQTVTGKEDIVETALTGKIYYNKKRMMKMRGINNNN